MPFTSELIWKSGQQMLEQKHFHNFSTFSILFIFRFLMQKRHNDVFVNILLAFQERRARKCVRSAARWRRLFEARHYKICR